MSYREPDAEDIDLNKVKPPKFDEADPHPNRDEDGEEIRKSKMNESRIPNNQVPKSAEERKKDLERRKKLMKETVKIVESLLEKNLDEEHIKKSLCLLSKTDYDDVTTERSIVKLCGNPNCSEPLKDIVKPGQQFKIDVASKMLFKAEERSMFCTVKCLKASSFIRSQLSDESLWMRFSDQHGMEGLCKQLGDIKLVPPEDKTVKEEEQPSTSKAKKERVSSRDTVSFPYIKKDHLEHLQQSMSSLKIREKEEVDDPN